MDSNPHPSMNTIIITGANRGIGLAAAKHLAAAGHPLILLCRDGDRGCQALGELAPPPPPHEHRMIVTDLASFDSIRDAAHRITKLDSPVAALLNNAATLPKRLTVSREGFEMQLAVNHLGHFLLTNLLLPLLLRASRPCRVVSVSSDAHRGPPFDFADPNFEHRPYRRTHAYQQSKLANVLFTLGLARRTSGTSVEPVALHPGVYYTGLLRDYIGGVPGTGAFGRVVGRNASRGGPILAKLAVGHRHDDLTGAYFNKSRRSTPSSAARDQEAQERLWEWSASAVGLSEAEAQPPAG